MRKGQHPRRQRGRNGANRNIGGGSNPRQNTANGRPKRPQNQINRQFESNGPDGKLRGTAVQLYERYKAAARDAQQTDRVLSEAFGQFAEHYYRLAAEFGAFDTDPQQNRDYERSGDSADGDDEHDGDDNTTVNERPDQNQGEAARSESSGNSEQPPFLYDDTVQPSGNLRRERPAVGERRYEQNRSKDLRQNDQRQNDQHYGTDRPSAQSQTSPSSSQPRREQPAAPRNVTEDRVVAPSASEPADDVVAVTPAAGPQPVVVKPAAAPVAAPVAAAEPDAASADDEAPVRRRRGRPRKDEALVQPVAEQEKAPIEQTAAEKPTVEKLAAKKTESAESAAPVRKRRATAAPLLAAVEAEGEDAGEGADVPAEAPRRRGRPRKNPL